MTYARVSGTGSYLPGQPVTNDDLVRRGVDTSDSWIVERTGIRARHFAAEDETTSDLALQASRRAIEAAGIAADDIDLIIVATSTPDLVFPSTASLLQDKLGIRNGGAAFDLQAVCSGFVFALATAEKFIRSGASKCALVVGAEAFSRILDWNDRGTCVLFGDGAGAVILEASDHPGIMGSVLHTDGQYNGILSVPGQLSCGRIVGKPFLQMDGQAVFKFAVKVLGEVAIETAKMAGITTTEIDWVIPHQANIRILQATARKLDLPMERMIVTLDRHGNTSAASVPMAFDVAMRDGRIRSGQKVLLEGVGGGFTWGAVLVRV